MAYVKNYLMAYSNIQYNNNYQYNIILRSIRNDEN